MLAVKQRALLWTLALAAGLVFQTTASRVGAPSTAGSACPPNVPELHANEPDKAVTCRGWGARDFLAGTTPADVLVRSVRPSVGASCQDVHYYRATTVGASVDFAFAGGVASGTLPLTADEARMVDIADPYVVDTQFGTYEPRHGGLACAIDPTYHFYCPADRTADRFCITWLPRSAALPDDSVIPK